MAGCSRTLNIVTCASDLTTHTNTHTHVHVHTLVRGQVTDFHVLRTSRDFAADCHYPCENIRYSAETTSGQFDQQVAGKTREVASRLLEVENATCGLYSYVASRTSRRHTQCRRTVAATAAEITPHRVSLFTHHSQLVLQHFQFPCDKLPVRLRRNVVVLRRARLILGWVTVYRRTNR